MSEATATRGFITILTTAGELYTRDIGAVINFRSVAGAQVTGRIAALVRQNERVEIHLLGGAVFTIPDDVRVSTNRPVHQRSRG